MNRNVLRFFLGRVHLCLRIQKVKQMRVFCLLGDDIFDGLGLEKLNDFLVRLNIPELSASLRLGCLQAFVGRWWGKRGLVLREAFDDDAKSKVVAYCLAEGCCTCGRSARLKGLVPNEFVMG